MKNINSTQSKVDPMSKAREGSYFKKYSQEAKERIRLGVEIYNIRETFKISQQELASRCQTTQKVISKIENGDVNIGFSLLNRIAKVLNFSCENWSRIFNFTLQYSIPSKSSLDIKMVYKK